jgi:dTDP-4-amino-4,6-dideoxygalactose transaminase
MSIPVFRPFIKRKDMDAVLTCLLSDQIGSGAETAALVADLAEACGAASGIACREHPRALALAVSALGLPPASRVAVGALSPRLWEDAILAAGHVPVVLDCSEASPCISVGALAACHGEDSLAAVVAGNELGFPTDMAAIRKLGLPVVADLTAVFRARRYDPETQAPLPPPDRGDVLVIGLEQDGLITSGGGVAVLAASRSCGAGLSRLAEDLPPEVFLPDMNAALARTQLRELPGFMERRESIAEVFRRAALRGRHRLFHAGGDGEAVPFSFPLVIQSSVGEVQVYARKKNVETRHAFARSIIASRDGAEDFDARTHPHAFGFSLRSLQFPLYAGLSQKEVETIEKVIATLP